MRLHVHVHVLAHVLAPALLLMLPAAAAQEAGLTLKIYKNLGLFGTPTATSIISAPEFEHDGSEPFSAEMVGTLQFPADGGVFRFDCNWTDATMGYVWVDGHMVCQDAYTYRPGVGNTDNPLPVNTFKRTKGIVHSLPFRAHFYYNGHGAPGSSQGAPLTCTGLKSVGLFDDSHHQCGFTQVGGMNMHNDWEMAASTCDQNQYKVAGATASLGQELWCGNTATPPCPKLASGHKGVPCPGNKNETCGDAWVLEVIQFDECHAAVPAPSGGTGKVGLKISWAKGTTRDDANHAAAQPITSDKLTSALPDEEAQRDELQRSMTTGWGPWMHSNMLAMVKLPDNAVVTPKICSTGGKNCISSAVPDGAQPHPGDRLGVATRVGLHAYGKCSVCSALAASMEAQKCVVVAVLLMPERSTCSCMASRSKLRSVFRRSQPADRRKYISRVLCQRRRQWADKCAVHSGQLSWKQL